MTELTSRDMGKIDDGGQAFPGQESVVLVPQECDHAHSIQVQRNGMSIRDYVAAIAMQGILVDTADHSLGTIREYVETAFDCADAFIAEKRRREKENG